MTERARDLSLSIRAAVERGTLTIGPLEEDGSMTLDLKVGPTMYASATDSIESLADDIEALVEVSDGS